MPTGRTIHLMRHAEGEHNATFRANILDPPLTKFGRYQACVLNDISVGTLQQNVELIVTSPMTRTLQTAIVSFPRLRARLEAQAEPQGIVVLSRLQEIGHSPCNTGRSRQQLERNEEFVGIDFSQLEDNWNSHQGIFHQSAASERAKWVRKWLRARPEKEIVVVAHGDILRKIAPGQPLWANCEVRQFDFESACDEEAKLFRVDMNKW